MNTSDTRTMTLELLDLIKNKDSPYISQNFYKLIYLYCIEKGKNEYNTEIFVNNIRKMHDLVILNYVLDTVLEYFMIKYTITQLFGVPDKEGTRKLILNF